MRVSKVADEDIASKIDVLYIEEQLADHPNVGIIFICTRAGRSEDDWTDEAGTRYLVIDLPFETVLETPDVRGLMLAMAKERLGLAA